MTKKFSEDLVGFQKTQRLAYESAVAISKEIKPGWSEYQAAKKMDTYLADHGVKIYFHTSFAWFGERAGFKGFWNYFQFLPSKKRILKENEVIILDTAPILNNFTADIGYSFSLEKNHELEKAQQFLLELRKEIPILFTSSLSTKEIWNKIDEKIKKNGYQNAHKKYPFSVLGHRIHQINGSLFSHLIKPFSLQTYFSLFSHGFFKELLGPAYNVSKEGLWAIEPHLAWQNGGAKFEEILVVAKDSNGRLSAEWLDENVPHMRKL